MHIQFLGAAGTVTGSSYALTAENGDAVMIDCGLYQGSPDLEKSNAELFPLDVSKLLAVVLTHAHLDHCGRLPLLIKQGFQAAIFMTPATREITQISLEDTAKIAKQDHPENPLYEADDVVETLELAKTVVYDEPFYAGAFKMVFRDAGHILGSASVEITDQFASGGPKKVVFSGDLGNTPQDLIQPTQMIDQAEIVVMESTYGDRAHPSEDFAGLLTSEVQAVEKNGGTLLIPAFAIERSQELLHVLAHLKKSGAILQETPVYFDSPMGQKVTEIFDQFPQLFNAEFAAEAAHGTPFHFPGLFFVEDHHERAELDEDEGVKVIIAGSGMMSGGRILHHAAKYLPLPSTRILFVGYQSELTMGHQILFGEKQITISEHQQEKQISIQAQVTQAHGLSSHADQPKLVQWLSHIQGVKQVFLTHGDEPAREALAKEIRTKVGISEVILPIQNERIETVSS